MLIGQAELGDLPVMYHFYEGCLSTLQLNSTWDVKCLLIFLATRNPLSCITMMQLSLKLAALLALTSSTRVHELVELDLSFASIKSDSWEFPWPITQRYQGHVTPQEKYICLLSKSTPRFLWYRYYMSINPELRQRGNLLASWFLMLDILIPPQVRFLPQQR